MNKKTIWDKIQNIDVRVLYWILFVGLLFPYIMPINLPISIETSTRDAYDTLKQINEEDVVVIDITHGVQTWAEWLPGIVAGMKVLVNQNAKIIIWSCAIDSQLTLEKIQTEIPGLNEYIYGEDIVFFGYYGSGESAVAQLGIDIRSIFTSDYYGTPIDQIPIMNGVNKADDISLVVSVGGQPGEYYVKHWQSLYGTPIVAIGIAMLGSVFMPYYNVGDLKGLVYGVKGSAELEQLIKDPGDATVRMDAINMSHIIVIVAILIANVGYYFTRRKS